MKIGFGTWRFFLAFLVVISHLWSGMIHGPAAYAVWGFFVLSGYLMTFVLIHKYGPDTQGIKDYAHNRFLRIFPAYWIACLLGIGSIVLLPRLGVPAESLVALNPQFRLPTDLLGVLSNVSLLPIFGGFNLVVPVSGALAVEVACYVLMPLMAFSRLATWLGFVLSLSLNLSHGLTLETFPLRYSSFFTCFLAFSIGALVCHYADSLKRITMPRASVLVWLLHCLVWKWYPYWPWTYGLYASALLSAWVVLSLAKQKTGVIDNFLGDLSYPIYLFHTAVGAWILLVLAGDHSFKFFALSFAVTLVVSWLVVVLVDKRLQKIKRRPSNSNFKKSTSNTQFTIKSNLQPIFEGKNIDDFNNRLN